MFLWTTYKGIRQNIENLFVPGATTKAQHASNARFKKRSAQMKAPLCVLVLQERKYKTIFPE